MVRPNALLAAATLLSVSARAQEPARVSGRSEIFAGGEFERYLRVLQIAGIVSAYPWSVRAFSSTEADQLLSRGGDHP